MEPTIHKTIELDNGYTLTIWDCSRNISTDAWLVRMKARMEIEIVPELFSNPLPEGVTPAHIQEEMGGTAAYEYEVERNFILNHEKEALFESMVENFLDNLGHYVARPVFPQKYVVKSYLDRVQQ